MSDEVEEMKNLPPDAEEQMLRVFTQLNTLYGTLIARTMIMMMNETLFRPLIAGDKDNPEVWCQPDLKKMIGQLGLKWNNKKHTIQFYEGLRILQEDGFLLKIMSKDKDFKKPLFWVNYDRIDELTKLDHYVRPAVTALFEEKWTKLYNEKLEEIKAKAESEAPNDEVAE